MEKQPFEPGRRGPFNLTNRVIWSLEGWANTFRTEFSFRSWVLANIVSSGLAFMLPIAEFERLIIVVLGVLVLAAELLNTAIEHLADLVEPAKNPAIKACKDAASAGVAVTACAAGVAWTFALAGLAGF